MQDDRQCAPAHRRARLLIDIIHFGGRDQADNHGRALAATIRPTEQPRLSSKSDVAQGTFSGIVGKTDAAIMKEAREGSRLPQLVKLLLEKPVISVPMAAKLLKVSNRAVDAMLNELGFIPRELSGRGRYRVWGIV